MSAEPTIWTQHPLANKTEVQVVFEHLHVRIYRRDNDLLLVERRGEEVQAEPSGHEPESDFRRYAFAAPVTAIEISPRTPDRPLVVQPAHPLRLAPKVKVDFYVSFPIDLQISTDIEGVMEPLERIRSEVLSDTWFGDQMAGVLCYSLKSRARRERQDTDSGKTGRAMCKMQIDNRSKEQLLCSQFCLRLDHCHLWRAGETLWTSPITVRYNGSKLLSAIDYSDDPPAEAPGAKKVASAAEEPLSGLIRRTFAFTGLTGMQS